MESTTSIITKHSTDAGSFLIIIVIIVCVCLSLWLLWNWIRRGKGQGADTGERKRIMEMIEAGKISTDEGKELLNALGNSTALRGQEKFSRADAAMLIGVALVILGFFLPWVYIRLSEVFGQVRMPDLPGLTGQKGTAYQAGYQAGALGWAVFIIAIVSAVPVFVTPKNFLYKILMLQMFLLIIGIALVMSVLIRAGGNLGEGLVACLAGFLVALVALKGKFKQLAA